MAKVPRTIPPLTPQQIECFWSLIDRSRGPHACHPWTGSRYPNGYGRAYIQGQEWLAHRVALFVVTGEQPPMAIHGCDYHPCCNVGPEHVHSGDAYSNMQDASQKGHLNFPKPWLRRPGENNSQAKLSNEQVVHIRALYAAGGVYQWVLAQRFGVSQTTISYIVRGARWSMVPGPLTDAPTRNLPKGEDHWSHRMPERLARGDRNGSRLHPESRPRGSSHWRHRYAASGNTCKS